MKIAGTIFVRNAIKFDYPVKEAILSLMPVCSEVVCVECYSEDNTMDLLSGIAEKHSKLRIYRHEWKPVVATDGAWLADIANFARQRLNAHYHVGLQADEVLHENSYSLIRHFAKTMTPVLCHRLNFWLDSKHRLPDGEKVGHRIVRCAPTTQVWWGDAESIRPCGLEVEADIQIFHYGFIRRLDAFINRSISFQDEWHGKHDPLFDEMKKKGKQPLVDHFPEDKLIEFKGTHPTVALRWLNDRSNQ